MNNELKDSLKKIFDAQPSKMVISKPGKKDLEFIKICVERKEKYYQFAKYTKTQVFHENIEFENAAGRCLELCDGIFYQINAWDESKEHIVLISKKGAVSYKTKTVKSERTLQQHNREKNYIIAEGTDCKPLIDMGVFTKEGKVASAMHDKYKQINRFIEIIDDEIGKQNVKELNIIDFGCGKSYLTFIVYYYLVSIKKIKANIIGLDLKEDVIKKCNEAAIKYGYENLHFEVGDVNGFKAPFDVDMVITLHACDTATDYALYNAIQWNASMIFSVPCCQHELNSHIAPSNLKLLSRYGIIKERFSALATDAIRANLLESEGYKTQLLEFIDFEHTPKNILIRAIRRGITMDALREKALLEVETLCNEFGFDQTLYRLLKK